MENTLPDFKQIFRLTFWRMAAGLTGLAVRHRNRLEQAVWIAPLMLAAALAYLLGRWVGMLLLWSLAV